MCACLQERKAPEREEKIRGGCCCCCLGPSPPSPLVVFALLLCSRAASPPPGQSCWSSCRRSSGSRSARLPGTGCRSVGVGVFVWSSASGGEGRWVRRPASQRSCPARVGRRRRDGRRCRAIAPTRAKQHNSGRARAAKRPAAHLVDRHDLAALVEPVRLRAQDLDLRSWFGVARRWEGGNGCVRGKGQAREGLEERGERDKQTHHRSALGANLLLGRGLGRCGGALGLGAHDDAVARGAARGCVECFG